MRSRFTARAVKVLELAQQEAQELGHAYVGTEHLLLGLAHEGEGVAAKALLTLGIGLDTVRRKVEALLAPRADGASSVAYTPRAKRVMELALEEAQALGHHYIGTEHILLGLIREREGIAAKVLGQLGADLGAVRKIVMQMLGAGDVPSGGVAQPGTAATRSGSAKKTPTLDEFGSDLTALATEGKLDPVVGRDKEIERVVQILSRRTKNNPVLIGEPGVGKTAVAEGLAQRIVQGVVPELLAERRVVSLSMASVVAGAKYRGEFEDRLKRMLEEIRQAGNVILFIDEMHTLIGAGAAEGAVDAANILKPVLARGQLQAIGATTLDEYKKHIEKDAALERRFQPVMVAEPSEEDAVQILRGIRDKYEAFHCARITDDALEAAVKLSHRYIADRFLPDKAIDLMDEAASKARLAAVAQPQGLKELEGRLEKLEMEKEAAITAQEYERAAKLRDEATEVRAQIEAQRGAWRDKDGARIVVTAERIAEVVAAWTGIPVQKLAAEESQRLLELESILHRRVVGQAEAVRAVAKAIRRARAGLKDAKRPIGSFLFLGPTGVGKTELAKALAECLFDDESAMIRFDMSEYMEKHTVSRMVGAPPGYVGFEEGGQLTDAVRRRPYAVILLDEIEKAHPDVFNLLLQVLEDGRLTDGQGRTVDFRNAVIIMTSNAGARHLKSEGAAVGFATRTDEAATEDAAKKRVLEEVKRVFRPEFLNRLDEMIVFSALQQTDLRRIVDLLLARLATRLEELGLTLTVDDAAKDIVIREGSDFAYGARPLKRALQKLVEDEIAERLLAAQFAAGDAIRVTAEDGALQFEKAAQPVALQ